MGTQPMPTQPRPYLKDARRGEEEEEGQHAGAGAEAAGDAVDKGGLARGGEQAERGADAVEDEGLVDGAGPLCQASWLR